MCLTKGLGQRPVSCALRVLPLRMTQNPCIHAMAASSTHSFWLLTLSCRYRLYQLYSQNEQHRTVRPQQCILSAAQLPWFCMMLLLWCIFSFFTHLQVIPPPGWRPRRNNFPDLKSVRIETPIRQHAFGQRGAYRCLHCKGCLDLLVYVVSSSLHTHLCPEAVMIRRACHQ